MITDRQKFTTKIALYWIQGDHSPGKPGKIREFQSGQGKVRENGKSQGKVREADICFIVQSIYQ